MLAVSLTAIAEVLMEKALRSYDAVNASMREFIRTY